MRSRIRKVGGMGSTAMIGWASMAMAMGCGGAVREAAPVADEETGSIVGGEVDTGDPSVVAVYAQQPGQPGGFLCTGSLIAPTVVLTAAHCVSEAETGANATFTVLTSANINRNAGPSLAVREVHANPRWSAKRLEAGHDQGIVVLAQPAALPVLPINRQALASGLRGKPVRIVGYGLNDGIGQTGAGIKRQAVTSLGAIQANLIAVGDSHRGTCNGDSGGPAFMSLNGQETIVGTTSYGNADCSDGGFDARVDTDLTFIDPYLLVATCTPACTGRSCGSDGCGGTCGACGPTDLCTDQGQCSAMAVDCDGGLTEQEPNNSALQANPLCAGGSARGSLSSTADQDWFTWTVPASSVYDAVLSGGPAAALRVYKVSATTGRLTFIGDGPEVSRHTDAGGSYVARIIAGASPATTAYTLDVTSTP